MIYLDHNGTSPASETHLQKLFSYLQINSGNPSSPHAVGRAASVALTQARRIVAQALGVDVAQLIFVSGATEANNLSTIGVLRYLGVASSHAITSGIEHPSVLEPLEYLQKKEGLHLNILNANSQGFISAQQIIENISEQTNYIALMAANNEVGSIQPVRLIGDFLHFKRWGVAPTENSDAVYELEKHLSPKVTKESLQKLHFHVDAVQAFGKLKSQQWISSGVDSCAVSAHKLGALPGVGALFLRRGRQFTPLILGGAQEKNRRAGTENLAGIMSFGIVCEELLQDSWWHKVTEMNTLRIYLYEAISCFPNVIMNTPLENVIPNTVNFSVCGEKKQKNGEDLLLELDLNKICASSGSACSSGANLPSKILLNMGRSPLQAKNAIRLSLSVNTTRSEIEHVVACLKKLLS
ncbi:MAG: aminotransferase class V-fold PLP-dependent enzyme [Bdellovibrionota bacterium]